MSTRWAVTTPESVVESVVALRETATEAPMPTAPTAIPRGILILRH